ncbi:MAG: hypothetical protein JZU65_13320 [Chlorobium sp.]|nr:hypothetical protein [Chlorobium sp.]
MPSGIPLPIRKTRWAKDDRDSERLIRSRKHSDEEEEFAHELHEFARKEIGSWFSLASPIKTTAGFSIKIELG